MTTQYTAAHEHKQTYVKYKGIFSTTTDNTYTSADVTVISTKSYSGLNIVVGNDELALRGAWMKMMKLIWHRLNLGHLHRGL